MSKLALYLKQGEDLYTFETPLVLKEGATITLKNIYVIWRFENVPNNIISVTLTNSKGQTTVVRFERWYWSFLSFKDTFFTEGVSLSLNMHNNTCRIPSKENDANLGELGPLLGFAKNTVIRRGTTKDSGKVNINRGLENITIGSNLVNTDKNFNRFGHGSNIIATLPVDVSQDLNGFMTSFKNMSFTAPLNNGNFKQVSFFVKKTLINKLLDFTSLASVIFNKFTLCFVR